MSPSIADDARLRRTRALRVLGAATVVMILLGPAVADEVDDFLAYWLVVSAAVLPAALWILAGARGIPIVPVLALGYIVYFALPILRGSAAELGYNDAETLRAAATVGLFLVVAALVSQVFAMRVRRQPGSQIDTAEKRELAQLVIGGLIVGAVYQSAALVGALDWLGYYSGLARAIALTLVTASCYLLGVAYGRRVLTGHMMILALTGLVANVLISWVSLFLVGGIFYLLAAALGHTISTARVPWRTALLALLVIAILHAGKQEMREKYWGERANSGESVLNIPVLMTEWMAAGFTALASGDVGKDISRRASLLWILLHVERVAPSPVPFLDGATYALLPQMLVPRFLDPEKIPSQAGMNLLNVHFGLLTDEETLLTAVGWGPLAEGYANFGYFGVIGAAVVLGLLGGALTAWSAGAPAVSLPALVAIAAMLQIANLEADLAYLFTSLLQSLVGVLIYFGTFRFLTRRGKGSSEPRAFAVPSRDKRG